MRKVTKKDKKLVIELLTKSFEDNKSVNYIIIQDEKRIRRISALMDYSFEMCYHFGEILISEDNNGCALLLYPELKRTTLRSLWLDLLLIFNCIGLRNMARAIKRESRINAIRPRVRMTYLWFIGVNPEYQYLGLGKSLMEEIIIKSKLESRKIFLETSTIENLSWYRKFGFEVYDEINLGYSLFFLRN